MNKTAYIDNIGYVPFCTFYVYDASDNNMSLYRNSSRKKCKEWMKERGYKMIVNPRFSNFANPYEEVKQFNVYGNCE